MRVYECKLVSKRKLASGRHVHKINYFCEFTNKHTEVALRAGLSNIPLPLQPPRYVCPANSAAVAACGVFPIPNPTLHSNANGKSRTQAHLPHGQVLAAPPDSTESGHIFQPAPCPRKQFL